MSSDAHEGCVTAGPRCVGPVNEGCLSKTHIRTLPSPVTAQDCTFRNVHADASQLSSEKFTDKNAGGSQISSLPGAGASYIINAYSVILSGPEFYFLISSLRRLFPLDRIRRKTNVSLFSLRSVAPAVDFISRLQP